MSAPAVAVSPNGNKLAVAWKDMRTGEPNVYWTLSATAEFGQESLLHDGDGKQDHPSLSIDADGEVWAAWEHESDDVQRICVRSTQTDTIQVVSEEDESPASFPVVATGGGLVAVVYESNAGDEPRVRFRVIERNED